MKPSIRNQKFGLLASILAALGFLGLIMPGLFHWNVWIHVYIFIRGVIWLLFLLTFLGFWLDRSKRQVFISFLATCAFFLAPLFSEYATVRPHGGPSSTVCFVDQSGAELSHITLYADGGQPMELIKSKYWNRVAKFAPLPVTDTPDLDLSAEVGFADGCSIDKQRLRTSMNGELLRHAIVFILSDKTLEVIPFY